MLDRFVPPVRRTDSRAESQLLQIIRAARFPEPIPQYRVWLSPTRWVDLDFAWPDQHGYCEFDPYKWHGDRDKYMRDATRRLELRGLGWDGVSVTDDELDSGRATSRWPRWPESSHASLAVILTAERRIVLVLQEVDDRGGDCQEEGGPGQGARAGKRVGHSKTGGMS